MAQGNARREGTNDPLAGATEIAATPVQASSLSVPVARVPDLSQSMTSKIASMTQKYSAGVLQETADVQHEASTLDGQMAYMQGQAIEEVETGGNKWALGGYRVMQAQSLSSTMLSAQQEMIRQSQYEEDPDTFRAKYVARMEAQVEGLDPQTARLVREQMSKHLPAIVAQQTTAHMQYQEQETFDALTNSVDIMSKDASAFDAMIHNAAGGPDSPSDGLSDNRREAAITEGVVRAFANGNPMAYAKLKASGVMESWPQQHKDKMLAAESQHQSRLRSELNKEYIADEQTLITQIETGELKGEEALDAWVAMQAQHGIKTTMQEGKASYSDAETANQYSLKTQKINLDAAYARKDWDTVAALTEGYMVQHESGGNPNAVGPVIRNGANKGDRAQGSHQVMTLTMTDPGFGIRPADKSNPKDVARVGKEYWAVMVKGSASGYNLTWEPGDIEAAAIAYNAGHVNAKKWIAAGRDYSVLPNRAETEPYAKGIAADAAGGAIHTNAKTEYDAAVDMKTALQKKVDITAFENLTVAQDQLNSQLENGEMSIKEFAEASRGLNAEFGVERTKGQITGMLTTINGYKAEISDAIDEATDDAEKVQLEGLKARQGAMEAEMSLILEDDTIPMEKKSEFVGLMTEKIADMYSEAGFTPVDWSAAAYSTKTANAMVTAQQKAMVRSQEDAQIRLASDTGTVGELPNALKNRAWKLINADLENDLTNSQDFQNAPQGEQQAQLQAAQFESWTTAGEVDPQAKAAMTATLNGSLLAEDGNPTAGAVGTINAYAKFKAVNPSLANEMLGEKARIIADAAILAGGGGPEGIVDGIKALENAKRNGENYSGIDPLTAERRAAEAAEMASNLTSNADISDWQGWWEGTNPTLAAVAEGREELQPLLEDYALDYLDRASAIGGLSPADVKSAAAGMMAEELVIVGNTVLQFPAGNSMRKQMFAGRASDFNEEGIEDQVIQAYIVDVLSKEPGGEFYTALGSADTTTFGMRALVSLGNAIPGLEKLVPDPTLSVPDALRVKDGGVRPYTMSVDQTGDEVGIRVFTQDGSYSVSRDFDLRAAGAHWIKKHNTKLSE